jgi:hypothetical protein
MAGINNWVKIGLKVAISVKRFFVWCPNLKKALE